MAEEIKLLRNKKARELGGVSQYARRAPASIIRDGCEPLLLQRTEDQDPLEILLKSVSDRDIKFF